MPEPRRVVLKRTAEGLHHPFPATVTYRELVQHIDSLPDDGLVDKIAVRLGLIAELDGAQPLV